MNRIKELRKKKKLTQKELAKELGLTQSVIGRYEQGDISPRPDKWQKMAEFFGVSVDYLKGAWSKNEILKLVQDCYISNLAYIDSLRKEQFEESKKDNYLMPLWVIAGGGKGRSNSEQLALSIHEYFSNVLDLLKGRSYSWLIKQDKKSGEYTALFFRDASEPELIKQLDTLKASLSIALNGNNREIVLNDSYIWDACFSGMLNDELITNLMQNRVPKSTLEIALRLKINSSIDGVKWLMTSKHKFNFTD